MKEIFRHAFIYGLAPVLQKAASLILLPLYTHYLTPSDYGEVEMLVAVTGAIGIACQLEYRQGFMRAFARAEGDEARRELFSSSFALIVITGLAGTLVLLATLAASADSLFGHALPPVYIAAVAGGVLLDTVSTVPRATAQAELWSARTVSIEFSAFVVGTLVSVWLIVGLRSGPGGFFVGTAAGSALRFAGFTWLSRGLLTSRFRWAVVRPVLGFSYPLLGGAVLYFVLRYSDRFVVGGMLSIAAVGIYGMTWKLANLLITFVLIPFQRSFDAWRYRLYEEGGHEATVARTFHHLMMLVAFAAVVVDTAIADLFVAVADPRYAGAIRYLPILCCGVVLQTGYTTISSAFYVTGETRRWLRLFVLGAAAQVVAMLALVPTAGLYGAALASALANLVLYVAAARGGSALWNVPYRHVPVGLAIAALAAVGVAHATLRPAGLAEQAAADGALICAYVAFLFAARLVQPGEVMMAMTWLVAKATRAARLGARA